MSGQHQSRLAIALALIFSVSTALAASLANDNADNDPYGSDNTFMPGQDGGSGFTSWVELETGTPGSMYLEESAPLAGNQSWGLSGTYALGRGLEQATAEATWTFTAMHGAGIAAFCGFSLRTSTSAGSFAESEILRFGIDYSEEFDNTRVYYSTDAGGAYDYLDLGDVDLRGVQLQYSVTWSTFAGSFRLGVENLDNSSYAEGTGTLLSGNAVAMLGVGIFEATLDERLTFDSYDLAPIPEPGTMAALGLGALGLMGARFRRSRRS